MLKVYIKFGYIKIRCYLCYVERETKRRLSKQSGEAGADFQITAAKNPKNVDLQKHRS